MDIKEDENAVLVAKYKIIAHLILKHKLEIEEICTLTPSTFSNYVDATISKYVSLYVNKNSDKIIKFFFFGRGNNTSATVASIIAGLRKHLSSAEFKALGISSIKEKSKIIKDDASIEDIKKLLNKM